MFIFILLRKIRQRVTLSLAWWRDVFKCLSCELAQFLRVFCVWDFHFDLRYFSNAPLPTYVGKFRMHNHVWRYQIPHFLQVENWWLKRQHKSENKLWTQSSTNCDSGQTLKLAQSLLPMGSMEWHPLLLKEAFSSKKYTFE